MRRRHRIGQRRTASRRVRSKRVVARDPRPLILLADDSRDDREMYGQYLRFAGYQVAEAADGKQAVALARKLRPTAIVMDLAMPRVDGREATRQLKADAATRDTPLLILTAHAGKGAATWALFEVGAEGFLAKPCLPDDLLAQLHRVLYARRVSP